MRTKGILSWEAVITWTRPTKQTQFDWLTNSSWLDWLDHLAMLIIKNSSQVYVCLSRSWLSWQICASLKTVLMSRDSWGTWEHTPPYWSSCRNSLETHNYLHALSQGEPCPASGSPQELRKGSFPGRAGVGKSCLISTVCVNSIYLKIICCYQCDRTSWLDLRILMQSFPIQETVLVKTL